MDDRVLEEFAPRHGIRRLAAFGSVLAGDFGPARDIELLLGRSVDLRTHGALSRYFRDRVRATAQELYAA